MSYSILGLVKRCMPGFVRPAFTALLPWYHRTLAVLAALIYRYPSRDIVVIGVTGTKGKSSTSFILAQLLERAGYEVGLTGTAVFKVGRHEELNTLKMTMPGRFFLQKMLRSMVRACCDIAIIETTSIGMKQFRHQGIIYDVAVFTNLYPEHIDEHGSFEAYRSAKEKLFEVVARRRGEKFLRDRKVPRTFIANCDSEQAGVFISHDADKKVGVHVDGHSVHASSLVHTMHTVVHPQSSPDGIAFELGGVRFDSPLLGEVNIYNVALALTVAHEVAGIPYADMVESVREVGVIPGRLEWFTGERGVRVVVDYAHEVQSLTALFEVVKMRSPRRVIHVFGATGGGRDSAKRPAMGALSDLYADYIILTNDDPYDDDPRKLAEDILAGIEHAQKVTIELDRERAIAHALELAQEGDIVVISGKGAEQKMCLAQGKTIPWDDRALVKKHLASI